VPPALRQAARVVRLIKFELDPENQHVAPRSEGD
jgi:hypothetical protein